MIFLSSGQDKVARVPAVHFGLVPEIGGAGCPGGHIAAGRVNQIFLAPCDVEIPSLTADILEMRPCIEFCTVPPFPVGRALEVVMSHSEVPLGAPELSGAVLMPARASVRRSRLPNGQPVAGGRCRSSRRVAHGSLSERLP